MYFFLSEDAPVDLIHPTVPNLFFLLFYRLYLSLVIQIGYTLFFLLEVYTGGSTLCKINYIKIFIPLQRETTCVGILRWSSPPTPHFRVGDTNILVSKNAKMCVTPNANPQCKQVEYRWRWVSNIRGWRWPCRFHVVCVHFIRVG